jgi:hypothetical protein
MDMDQRCDGWHIDGLNTHDNTPCTLYSELQEERASRESPKCIREDPERDECSSP